MKLQSIALIALLAAVATAQASETVDCFYEANQAHPACAVDTKAGSATVSNIAADAEAQATQVAAAGMNYNADDSVDCFYDANRYRAACR